MRVPWLLSASLLITPLTVTLPTSRLAGEPFHERTFFEAAPSLENVRTTMNDAHIRGATYYFTISLPADAGASLGEIIIKQRGGMHDIPLLLDETTAFIGTSQDKQDPLSLSEVSQIDDNRTIRAAFDPPVEPGTTFTLGLTPQRNPSSGGVYQFGVTVVPDGETPEPFPLGLGRLQFYEQDNHPHGGISF